MSNVLQRLRRTSRRLSARLRAAGRAYYADALWLLAIGLLAHGVGLYSAPLEFVVWGLALMLAVMLGGAQRSRRGRRR